MKKYTKVLVPFYRGAVVFRLQEEHKRHTASSRPLLSRSGCIFKTAEEVNEWLEKFSSPFIEERLYLIAIQTNRETYLKSSRPLLSRSGCI